MNRPGGPAAGQLPASSGRGDDRPRADRLGRGGSRSPRRARHAKPGRGHGPNTALTLAAAVAVAAAIPLGVLAVKTLGQHGSSAVEISPLAANRPVAPHSKAVTFTATAGPGCETGAGASAHPRQAPNGDGWHVRTAPTAGPCGKAFAYSYLAMVTGSPDEWHDSYTWLFATKMTSPSCTVSVYIPAVAQANSPASYWLSASPGSATGRTARFTIGQAAHHGAWVTKGPFTFPGGTALIEETDQGEGPVTAAVVAGPARLTC